MKENLLSIQEVLQLYNSNKYFKLEGSQGVYWLQNKQGILNLILVKGCEEDLYEDIRNLYTLGYIVNSKYKEVQYKC